MCGDVGLRVQMVCDTLNHGEKMIVKEEVEMKIRIKNVGKMKIGAWTCANVIRRRKSYID